MANHKSALKRIRANDKKRVRNRYQEKTEKNTIKALRSIKDKKEASEMLPKVISTVDRLAKKKVIHKSKADNLKRKLTVFVNGL